MSIGSVRRKHWYLAAIGSVAGVSGLAAMGLVVSGPPTAVDADPARRVASSMNASGGDATPATARNTDRGGEHTRKDEGHDSEAGGRRVPCDSDLLIAALVRANGEGVGRLELEPKCTYTLTAFDEDETGQRSGLPAILGRVSIEGNGATIVRAANAEPFRIFNVGSGGDLTLRHLTVKGGYDSEDGQGGGGLLVQRAGRATIEASTFTLNRSAGAGGAISNLGVTRIAGGEPSHAHGEDRAGDTLTEITHNFSEGEGGAISNDVGLLTMDRVRLSDNSSLDDGGAFLNLGVARVSRTAFERNHSVQTGGAIVVDAPDAITELRDSSLSGNTSNETGGAISTIGGHLSVQETDVSHNTALFDGGGIANSTGLVTVDRSRITQNVTLTGRGGGFSNLAGPAVLRDTEVKLNRAPASTGVAGGIENVDADLSLINTTIVENSSTRAPGGVFSNTQITVDDDSTIVRNRPTNCAGSPNDIPNCFG
ncbi:hypothetical protein [Actinopolymorpha pittospori]|uniref:Polymorphic outer membrane protein repeat-containing protein n=1 Tax=Actinopolymorpha pittospori TaxID=648752 RepID=A0A927RID9_9ACTN|nr:hypothetical protein [Actinopolymorpha pittospori]MBE1613185.1 hypothetical protein [Actinopolymorpha pittospori]